MMVRQHMMLVLSTGGVAATFNGAVQGGLTDGTMTIASGDIAAARDVQMTRDQQLAVMLQ